MAIKSIQRLTSLFYSIAKSEFFFKELENDSYNARKEYAEKHLKHLSSGSSRIVYLTKENTVIKLAKNNKGIAQNKAEANPKMTSKFLNKIIKYADNFAWIETHYLEKITEKEFEKLTDLNFKEFGDAISYGLRDVSSNSDQEKPDNFDTIKKSEIFKEIEKLGKEFHLLPGDMSRISSWGKKDNVPVLIDAGLTRKVYDKYYDDSSS